MSRPNGWDGPPLWSVPREWVGERAFVICGGMSILKQRHLIPKLKGRIIAIKEGVLLRPDADVLFLGGEKTPQIALPLIPKFTGRYMIVRGKSDQELPPEVVRVTRWKDHTHWSDLPTHVCGYDSGTSAINLAYLFGATEIVVLGYDMCSVKRENGTYASRWFDGEWPHPMPHIPEAHFQRHMAPLLALSRDATAKGFRVVNVSPITRVTAFERQPLEAFL